MNHYRTFSHCIHSSPSYVIFICWNTGRPDERDVAEDKIAHVDDGLNIYGVKNSAQQSFDSGS